ncbi:phosphatase PAP2 family protein [Streptomyces sp. C10-9-1]|uniref:phosphatase PAP2 family protein n=1 Tax=Streptomyces sp. C10-9-1 TaxID=1859285 RepID=UPI002110F77D|nr:phosphatase PAP2 family protein [Streptomyces sp. C10-9-1]MCQ6554723.1 phosphatase PAP2 family protein [Streptomyces sp. C10-9-1]
MASPPPPRHDPPPRALTARGRRAAAGCAAVLLVSAGVLTLLVASAWTPLVDLDREVVDALHRSAVADPGATRASRILTDWVWDPWTVRLLLAAAVVVLWVRRDRVAALWAAGAGVLGAAVQQVLKALVDRRRPAFPDPVDTAHFSAFPSGHAMTAALGCGLLVWLVRRWSPSRRLLAAAAAAAAVSIAGVGLTRVYLGVHWPSDVLAGWLLGLAAAALAVYGAERRTAPRRG